jgi:NADH-quinone oxidoreductase subunit L
MTVPLMVLAFLSVVGGWFALPAFWGGPNYFAEFLGPVFGGGELTSEEAHRLELVLSGVAVLAATVGLLVAWRMYGGEVKRPKLEGLSKVLYKKYYVDEFYQTMVVEPLLWLSRNVLWKVVDVGVIDATVNGVAHGATAIGDTVRRTQSGNARSYAVWVLIGAIVVFAIIFWPIFHPVVSVGVR